MAVVGKLKAEKVIMLTNYAGEICGRTDEGEFLYYISFKITMVCVFSMPLIFLNFFVTR